MNRYTFNADVQTVDPPEGSQQAVAICEIPTRDGGRLRYAVPIHLLSFFKLFDGATDTEDIVRRYNESHNQSLTVDKADKLIRDFCVPKAILISSSEPAPELVSRPNRSYLYGKVRVLTHSSIYPLARRMAFLFSRYTAIPVCVLSLLAHLMFYLWAVPKYALNLNRLSGYQFILVTLITIIAAFFHELGHASALALSNCERLEIGVGLYLYIPVLYTDVSEAWRLQRLERARGDAGGIYFHIISQLILLTLFAATADVVFLYSFFFIDVTMAYSLNPFLRMDGYWLVADLFGIFNLRKQSISNLSYLAGRLWNPKGRHNPPDWQLTTTATLVLSSYTILSVFFFAYLIIAMFRQVIFFLIPAYPEILTSLISTLTDKPFNPVKAFGALLGFGWRSLVIVGCTVFIIRTILRILQRLKRSQIWDRMFALKKITEDHAS